MKICLWLTFLLSYIIEQQANAQNVFTTGARALSLSGASNTLSDVYAVQNNIAGIAQLKTIGAGVYYENRFLVKQLANYGLTSVVPINYGNVGFIIYNEQSNGYTTTRIGGGFARTFGKQFHVGLGLNYINTRFSDAYYGQTGKFAANIGMQANVLENLTIGVNVYNPTQSIWKKDSLLTEYIPTLFNIGLKYTFSKVLFTTIQFERNTLAKAFVSAGLEYNLSNQFYLRGGISSSELRASFGFGYNYKKQLLIDMASAYHVQLGFVPQVSICFLVKEKNGKAKGL